MRIPRTLTALAAAFALPLAILASPIAAPLPAQTATRPVAPSRLDSVARRIVLAARYATLATVDGRGQPQLRTVQARTPDTSWTVWFATNPRTRKVQEIEQHGAVAMHWFDPATDSFVALTGRARIVRGRAEKDAHWDAAWNAFYPDRDRGVVLIAVEAQRIEVVSPRFGVDSDPTTWRPQAFVPQRRK